MDLFFWGTTPHLPSGRWGVVIFGDPLAIRTLRVYSQCMDPEDFAGVTERLAVAAVARSARTGETFEAASVAVVTEWTHEWPTVAVACAEFARHRRA